MKYKSYFLLGLFSLLPLNVGAVPYGSSAPVTEFNLQCVLVGFELAANADDKIRNAGTIISIYYLGLLDGAGSTDAILENSLLGEAKKMKPNDFPALQPKCQELLKNRALFIRKIGGDLKK